MLALGGRLTGYLGVAEDGRCDDDGVNLGVANGLAMVGEPAIDAELCTRALKRLCARITQRGEVCAFNPPLYVAGVHETGPPNTNQAEPKHPSPYVPRGLPMTEIA
jgi:hypothetical protein